MINYKMSKDSCSRLSKRALYYLAANIFALGTLTSISQAGETPPHPENGGTGHSQSQDQSQDQYQQQNQDQFQGQNQGQRQGDNSVEVDGDNVDYFALALPNLVAASCAGSSYSIGGGGGGIGFGFGAATVDVNCQIAKAIATAHLLDGAKLVNLTTREYRHALCQMRGMEHVCKTDYKEPQYKSWCERRVRRDAKASKWSDRDLRSCGIRRAYFVEDRRRWLELTHYDGTKVEQHEVVETTNDANSCLTKAGRGNCAGKTTYRRDDDVVVRVGQHCDFDRVVFDWPKEVDYKIKRYGNEIAIDFDRDSPVDVSNVRKGLGRFIVDARSEKHATGSTTTLILASDVKGRVWDWDNRVIVDGRGTGCY